jgi:putative phosphoesterase
MQMTLVAVLADIHSNLPALKKVLEECDHSRPDMYLIAGDIVGYNPYPNEVIEELAKIKRKHMIMGNHDRATFTGNTEWFNAEAAEAVRWTRKNVKQENMEILGKMKDKLRLKLGNKYVLLCHGSPNDPDEYVFPNAASEQMLRENRVDVVIMGHTHVAFVREYPSGIVLNPGAVGQPRDGDPRAAAMVIDLDSMEITKIRVDYDIDATADEIEKVGLPKRLADRLYHGT